MKIDDETIDVLIGGYLSADAAEQDYEAVLACGGYLHGAVVVSKDLEGNLSVEQTDHMVREGAEGLGARRLRRRTVRAALARRHRHRRRARRGGAASSCTTSPAARSRRRRARRSRSAARA